MNNLTKRLGLGLGAAFLAAGAASSVAAPAGAATTPSPLHIDTGWVSYDGGCQARTVGDYWPATNTLQLQTSVKDPYLFVACRVNAKAGFATNTGPVTDGPTQAAMACAVLDPTCASSTTTPLATYRPASYTLETLKDYGVNLTKVVKSVSVTFSKA